MRALLRQLIIRWESCQVELHGRYSVSQLTALAHYEKSSSSLHVLAVLLMTPLPCTIQLVAIELIPLKLAFVGGLASQGAAYWVRTLYSSLSVAFMVLTQFSYCSPGLPLSTTTLTVVSLAIMTSTTLTFLCLHLLIGFPTPFLYAIEALFWQGSLVVALVYLWGDRFRSNLEARQDLIRYGSFWNAQSLMIVVYPAMTYVFRTLDGHYQTLFSMVLPLVKLVIKNLASQGVHRLEQYAAICVTFSVDVFHALFFASAMQSSRTVGTLAIAVVVDVFQSLVAVYEVHTVLGRIQRLQLSIRAHESKDAVLNRPLATDTVVVSPIQPAASSAPLYEAVAMLAASRELREHPQIALPRHAGGFRNRDSLRYQSTRVAAAAGPEKAISKTTKQPVHHKETLTAIDQQQALNVADQARLCFVQETAQLMSMAEFYVLIELTEVIVTAVYAFYLGVMFFLPNRYNFLHLKHLSDEQYLDTLAYVANYAAYEFLSLLVLVLVLRRMLGISPIRHVAFTLEKNWRLAQSLLTVWVFFPIQMSLDHLGNDYTMKFEWLHKMNP